MLYVNYHPEGLKARPLQVINALLADSSTRIVDSQDSYELIGSDGFSVVLGKRSWGLSKEQPILIKTDKYRERSSVSRNLTKYKKFYKFKVDGQWRSKRYWYTFNSVPFILTTDNLLIVAHTGEVVARFHLMDDDSQVIKMLDNEPLWKFDKWSRDKPQDIGRTSYGYYQKEAKRS